MLISGFSWRRTAQAKEWTDVAIGNLKWFNQAN
jgi:hypothetical protein